MSASNTMSAQMAVDSAVERKPRNIATGAALAALCGGLGLFYTSVTLGVVMSVVQGFLFALTILTAGWAALTIPVFHAICVVVAVFAIGMKNADVASIDASTIR